MIEPSGRGPSNVGLRRIAVAVASCVVVLVGLAAWVLLVPVKVDHPELRNGGERLDCDHLGKGEFFALRSELEQRCDEAEVTRWNTALIAGGVAVTVAFAASTWPSRRLTGEELGPIR